MAAAWKSNPNDHGKDRSFVSKAEHGSVKRPPSPVELFYIARGLRLPLTSPSLVAIARASYGKDKVDETLRLWQSLQLAQRVLDLAEESGWYEVRELAAKAAQAGPEDPVYGLVMFHLLAELLREPGYSVILLRLIRSILGQGPERRERRERRYAPDQQRLF